MDYSSSSDDEDDDNFFLACTLSSMLEDEEMELQNNIGKNKRPGRETGRSLYLGPEPEQNRWESSLWWVKYMDSTKDYNDPSTKIGKKWRLRFRIPRPVFDEIVSITRAATKLDARGNIVPVFREKDATGRATPPLELYLMGVFRVLGRGWCFDDVEEATEVNQESHRRFFHKWTEWWSKTQWSKYVHPPETKEEIHAVMETYRRLGLPGAIGSTDGVHLSWLGCPASEKNLHTGKEGNPTVVYNVTVDHMKKIISSSRLEDRHPPICNY